MALEVADLKASGEEKFAKLSEMCGTNPLWDADFKAHPFMKWTFKLESYACTIQRMEVGAYGGTIELPCDHSLRSQTLEEMRKSISLPPEFRYKSGGELAFDCVGMGKVMPFDQVVHKLTGHKGWPKGYVFCDYEYAMNLIQETVRTLIAFLPLPSAGAKAKPEANPEAKPEAKPQSQAIESKSKSKSTNLNSKAKTKSKKSKGKKKNKKQ